MTGGLSKEDKRRIDTASGLGVLQHASQMRNYLTQDTWLSSTNVYRQDVAKVLKASGSIKRVDLGEYVAASIIAHLFDGWTYFGQALYAQVRGMPDLAIHLCYYAELRATNCLLATQGIGVFDDDHVVFTEHSNVKYLERRGTHEAAWLYLDYWANLPASWQLLGNIVQPGTIPLTDWLASMYPDVSWAPVSQKVLHTIGLDLDRMSRDRKARNAASYTPTSFNERTYLAPTTQASFLSQAIRFFEPSASGIGFAELDYYLLRLVTELAFRNKTDLDPASAKEDYNRHLNMMLEGLSAGDVSPHIRDYLFGSQVSETPFLIIGYATETDNFTHYQYHLQMLGRATLLLRFATGAARDFMKNGGISIKDLQFWWGQKGIAFGLWDKMSEVTDALELSDYIWYDVAEALDHIDSWCTQGEESVQELMAACGNSLRTATNLGCMALLGLVC